MSEDKSILTNQFLDLTEELFHVLVPGLSLDVLSLDMTVAQMRVMFTLRSNGPCSMSTIASNSNIVPSTATGIVDNLVSKGLVIREDDKNDRRRVICKLSDDGKIMIDGIWAWGRSQIEKLLDRLTPEQLGNGCEVVTALIDLQNEESLEERDL
ncbi:MAG: MarR family transcriptional regulator [bacterium]|nr:MarR family transcriptional regulator [bacterium]